MWVGTLTVLDISLIMLTGRKTSKQVKKVSPKLKALKQLLSQAKDFLNEASSMATENLNLRKNIQKSSPQKPHKGDKAETLQKCL